MARPTVPASADQRGGDCGGRCTTVWRCRPTARSSAGDTTTTARPPVPASATNVVAIAAGLYHSLALKADGTVVGWGGNDARPDHHSRQCDQRGGDCGGRTFTVWRFGPTARSSAGETTTTARPTFPPVRPTWWRLRRAAYHSLALKADGTVVGWGDNDYGQTTIPASATNVVAIAAGSNHSLALKADGTVVGWGYNDYGQTTIPASATNVVAIAAGG